MATYVTAPTRAASPKYMRGGPPRSLLFVLGILFLAASSGLKAQDFSGKTVVSVEYDPVVQPLDPRDLQSMQLVRAGEPLNLNRVATSIDRMFASGHYEDIQVHAEPRGNGVTIRFVTRVRRFIGHVDAYGDINDPPNRSVIISEAQLRLGAPFDEEALVMARKTIEQVLRQNGLFHAQAGVATLEDPVTHQMTVRFQIEAGSRARYEMPAIRGDTRLSNETIVRATGWRIPLIHWWRQVTATMTDRGVQGVQRRYAKVGRLTASVNLASLDYNADTGRARASFDIDAGPRVTIKAVEAKVSQSRLRRYVPVFEEASVDNDLLTEGARNLRDYFQSKGYPDVDVTFKRERPEPDHEIISYYIATGPRRRLVKVEILGNDYFQTDTLRERMFLRPSSLVMRYGRYSENFRRRDEEAIENLYRANGFRDVRVTSTVQTNYNGRENEIAVTFHIHAGKQWKVAQLKVEGVRQLDLTSIKDQFSSTEGQPFAEVNIASDRNLILQYYYAHGFQGATFRYAISPNPDTQTVDLVYTISEGPQQFVRQVIISGLQRTRPALVQRRIRIEAGEPISMEKINEMARRLTALGVFANVNTALQNPDGATRYKNVLYDFDEAARYSFNLGFGLEVGNLGGTTTNLSEAGGSKGVSPIVTFEVNRNNFLGRAQTVSLQIRYSRLEQRESLNYIVPYFLGSVRRTLTLSALYNTTQNVQTFSSRRAEASVQVSQRLNRASTILGRFAYRRVSTSDVAIPSLLIPLYTQPVRIGILSASYIQDRRDNPVDAHRGFWNTVDAGVAGKFFGSQREFYRVLARNATYTSLGRNLVFARQTQVGIISPFRVPSGLSSFEAIPLPERLYGGGSTSMRGFGNNQAGPRDIGTASGLPGPVTTTPTGFPIGGNGLFFNTLELRFPLLWPNITGVAFHDMGNIYTNFGDISLRYHQNSNRQDFNYAVQSVGFGIRYRTPVGPVRVDFAYTLNPTRYLGFSTNASIQDLIKCGPDQIGKIPQCTATGQRLGTFQFFFSIGQAF